MLQREHRNDNEFLFTIAKFEVRTDVDGDDRNKSLQIQSRDAHWPASLYLWIVIIHFVQPKSNSSSWNIRTTVRLSNFDRWNPKMGVFLQSTEATPCEQLLE